MLIDTHWATSASHPPHAHFLAFSKIMQWVELDSELAVKLHFKDAHTVDS